MRYYMQYIDDCQCIILKKNMNHSTHILNHLIHILLFITKIQIYLRAFPVICSISIP